MPKIKKRIRKPISKRAKDLKHIRALTPTHILEVELKVSNKEKYKILRTNEHLRVIHNTVLGILYKNYNQMVRTKEYKKLIKNYAFYKTLMEKENKKDVPNKKEIENIKAHVKLISKQLASLKEKYKVTFTFGRKYGEFLNKYKFTHPDSVTTLSVCEIAWKSMEGLLYNGTEKVRFYKKGEQIVFQGKQFNRSIILKKDLVSFLGLKLPIIVKKDDLFVEETLSLMEHYIKNSAKIDDENIKNHKNKKPLTSTYRIRNNRIIIRKIRGKYRFYLQIALEGMPVPKRNKDGSIRHKFGKGKIGGDIGTQSIGIVGKKKVFLKNLAERYKTTLKEERKVYLLRRYLDRSRRAMNPNKYNKKGEFIGSSEPWKFSKRYMKALHSFRELNRKASDNREISHNEDVNRIRAIGDVFYIEKMDIKGLQKKVKEVTKNKRTGKFNKRKRFGKSILNRSPGYFIAQAKERFKATGGIVLEVNTWSFKASQYCHMTDDFIKKKLSHRWHILPDGTKIQRDLYSSFLLYCSDKNLQLADRNICNNFFKEFKEMHDKCIEEIKNNRKVVLNSGI